MSLDADSALNALTLVVDAVRPSGKLQAWFQGLAGLSESARRQALELAVGDLRAQGEPEHLVEALRLLAHPQLFAAVATALEECGVSG